jgi:ribonuclease P protein component
MLKPDILRNPRDFTRLYKKGRSVGEKYIVLFYIKNNLPYSRRAFLASKKVGNSVRRNRARRLMKESYRRMAKDLPAGMDILFIARSTIEGVKCGDVELSMRRALTKGKLLK